MSEQSASTSTPSSSGGFDLAQAVWQLRILVCGLGAALVILSLAFNLFVWKQNRNITAAAQGRWSQAAALDARVKQLMRVANDLGNYSAGKPELVGIFSRYGLELKAAAPAAVPAAQP